MSQKSEKFKTGQGTDLLLSTLKMEKGSHDQGMQSISRSWNDPLVDSKKGIQETQSDNPIVVNSAKFCSNLESRFFPSASRKECSPDGTLMSTLGDSL